LVGLAGPRAPGPPGPQKKAALESEVSAGVGSRRPKGGVREEGEEREEAIAGIVLSKY
jgi:hypothetical protein